MCPRRGWNRRVRRRTFGVEQGFLRRALVVDAVEGKRELLSLVLGVRDLDESRGLPIIDAVGVHDDISVQLFFKQRTDSGNNTHRHGG